MERQEDVEQQEDVDHGAQQESNTRTWSMELLSVDQVAFQPSQEDGAPSEELQKLLRLW